MNSVFGLGNNAVLNDNDFHHTFKPVFYNFQEARCNELYDQLKGKGKGLEGLPEHCKPLVRQEANHGGSVVVTTNPSPPSPAMVPREKGLLSMPAPQSFKATWDDPQSMDASLNRALSTYEIVERSRLERRNSRIAGSMASDIPKGVSQQLNKV